MGSIIHFIEIHFTHNATTTTDDKFTNKMLNSNGLLLCLNTFTNVTNKM